jgi:hypothetical protein
LSKSSLRTWVHVGGRKGQIVSVGVVLLLTGQTEMGVVLAEKYRGG